MNLRNNQEICVFDKDSVFFICNYIVSLFFQNMDLIIIKINDKNINVIKHFAKHFLQIEFIIAYKLIIKIE